MIVEEDFDEYENALAELEEESKPKIKKKQKSAMVEEGKLIDLEDRERTLIAQLLNNSDLFIKGDATSLTRDAEVISLVYQIFNLLNVDALIKINISDSKYDKLREYLDLLEINFEIDDKIKTNGYAYEVYSNDVKLGDGCKSHASIDLEKALKDMKVYVFGGKVNEDEKNIFDEIVK